MYGWLWHRLPGPVVVRMLTLVVAAAAIVLLLFTVVYPAVYPHLPFAHVTVDTNGQQ